MSTTADRAVPVTADELLRMPETTARYELVRGVLRERPFLDCRTGAVTADLLSHLAQHVERFRLGTVYAPTGFRLALDPDTVRAPAVSFVSRDRDVPHGDEYIPGAPDLGVEAVLRTDGAGEMDERAKDYLAAGCRMLLVVDAAQHAVEVFRPGRPVEVLTGADAIDGGDVVPGWTLPLRDLFG